MKGIILAGGLGTRLYPLTKVISKQLLPVYDKPMIYYPLSTLMLAGIRDILIISTRRDMPAIKGLLSSGSHLGLNIQYESQDNPRGLPDAFIIGEKFIGNDDVCLILGDNIFYGNDFPSVIETYLRLNGAALILANHVKDPERYGVVEFDSTYKIISIEEKPTQPKSNWAIPGFYCFDSTVVDRARRLSFSARGELEICDLMKSYLEEDKLVVQPLGRGIAWFDAGTYDSLLAASNFVQLIQERQGLKIACLEEIAKNKGFV